MEGNAALYVLAIIALAELAVIYGLVQRLLIQAKLPPLKPQEVVDLDGHPLAKDEALPAVKMRIKTGAFKVGL